ncbi:hypothetical protein [Streptomyces sp. NBC_00576]|uniref:hypothetical protein n=1 Tax=Streptomyces sp. NBC_00576 TaxID=2903665 RepID=UPI002E7FE536|nr:hypothetical protein [Streptomyces sp. NBC_00576]WUB70569.1 hypothetical protein OG734_11000 [Streptomyces sp. NBC_00576]
MYAPVVGPAPSSGGVTGQVMALFHGRSSARFAFLAGFSIILMTAAGSLERLKGDATKIARSVK